MLFITQERANCSPSGNQPLNEPDDSFLQATPEYPVAAMLLYVDLGQEPPSCWV